MRKKADRLFELLDRFIHACDSARDGRLQDLMQSRIFLPLRCYGLSADFLTAARGIIALILFAFFANNALQGYDPVLSDQARRIVLAGLLIAFITDLLDGPLARVERKAGIKTDLKGEHRDPLADKLLTTPLLIFYWFAFGWWTRAILGLTVVGDLAATAIRKYSSNRGISIPSNNFGRAKMAGLCVAIYCMVWLYPQGEIVVASISLLSLGLGTVSVARHARLLKRQLEIRREEATIRKGARG